MMNMFGLLSNGSRSLSFHNRTFSNLCLKQHQSMCGLTQIRKFAGEAKPEKAKKPAGGVKKSSPAKEGEYYLFDEKK
jgi:hypothetical protein